MKILHYNIHSWLDAKGLDNVERVAKLIGDHDPDVVSLVEVDETWGQPSNIEHIADQLGYHWAFIPAFEYRQQGGFGNALLSRTPFLSVQQRDLLPPAMYDGTEPSEPRTVLLAQIDSPHGRIAIGSTHLPRSSIEPRQHAATQLLNILQRIEVPWIVCGDFNQTPAWLDDHALGLAPKQPTPTYPASGPIEPIDYAIARDIPISGRAIPDNDASDHLPILIETAEPASTPAGRLSDPDR
ncbi:MAG: endonuclease/exonuclease/phosphatase family protein [Acidimicrobiales bacterium]